MSTSYKEMKYFIQKYGFQKNYWNKIFNKLGYTRSSEGVRATRLLDENKYIQYLESLKVKGTIELDELAA